MAAIKPTHQLPQGQAVPAVASACSAAAAPAARLHSTRSTADCWLLGISPPWVARELLSTTPDQPVPAASERCRAAPAAVAARPAPAPTVALFRLMPPSAISI